MLQLLIPYTSLAPEQFSKEDLSTKKVLTFNSFIASTSSRKRARKKVLSQSDFNKDKIDSCLEPLSRKAPKKVKRLIKELYKIFSRKGLSLINYTKIAKQFKANLDFITLI